MLQETRMIILSRATWTSNGTRWCNHIKKNVRKGKASTYLNRMSLFHHEFILLLSFTIQYLLVGIIQIYLPKLLQVSNQSIGSRWLTKLKYIPLESLESIIWGVGTQKMDGSSSEKNAVLWLLFRVPVLLVPLYWPNPLFGWWYHELHPQKWRVWMFDPFDPSVTIHFRNHPSRRQSCSPAARPIARQRPAMYVGDPSNMILKT